MSVPKKKPKRKKRPPVKKPVRNAGAPVRLSPPQIAVTAGLLSGFFDVESVLYNRDNELKVILTSRVLTQVPILGNPGFIPPVEDAVNFLGSTFVPKTL